MGGAPRVTNRVARACVTIVAIGLVMTATSFVFARDVVTRLGQQRVDRPANAAVLGVQQMSSAVDQVLALRLRDAGQLEIDAHRVEQIDVGSDGRARILSCLDGGADRAQGHVDLLG